MKCPYAVHRQTIRQTTIEYNGENMQTGYTEIEKNSAAFLKCLKENCGAWQNGKCCYNGER